MLLADIGNTRIHIYDGEKVVHYSHKDAIELYSDATLRYICVNSAVKSQISDIAAWKDIAECMHIDGEYDTMGIDRKALCLSYDNGVFVDAGSAITVDMVKNGIYQGGFILPGIKAYLESYKSISPALNIELNRECSLDFLPLTTKDSVSYGIIASIKKAIDSHVCDMPLYFTGGDGKWLSSFFPNSKFDEFLVFRGMKKALKDNKC